MSFNNEFEQHKNKLASGLTLVVCLLLPFFALYWMVPFIGKYVIGNDYTKYWIENQMFLRFSLSNGTFPLYAPGFNGGWTSSALTLGQLYHPISWLSAIIPGYWRGFALQINTYFRLVELGGTCAVLFLFLRKLRLSIPLAFILSFITVFNLRMLDMFRYAASLENYIAMLLLCTTLGWFYLSPNNRLLLFCISVCSWLLIVGGHPQIAIVGLFGTAVVYIVFPFYASCLFPDEYPLDFRRVFRFWGWSAFSVMLGILMASIYILPLHFEYLKESFRGTEGDFVWSCNYLDAPAGIIFNFFNPFFSDVNSAFGGSALILLAALFPLAGLFYLPRAWPIFVIWVGLVAVLIFSLGTNSLYYYFWKYFPFAQTCRVPGRLCNVLPFAFMLILAWMLRQKPIRLARQRGLSLDPIAMVSFVALVLFFIQTNFYPLTSVLTGRFVPLTLNNKLIPSVAVSFLYQSGLICLASVIMYRMSDKFKILALVCILASVLVASITTLRYGTWIEPGNFRTKTYAQMLSSQKQQLSYRADTGDKSRVLTKEHLKHTFLEPTMARICRKYETVNSQEEAYQRLEKLREIDLAYIEGWQGNKSNSSDSDPNIDSVKLEFSSFNNCIFDAFCAQPAFFVFSYPYSSRWQAKVDGKVTPVYRCNAIEHAVRILPGNHSIEFSYHSPATVTGDVISCLTLVAIIIWYLFRNPKMAQIRWPATIVTVILCTFLLAVVFYSFYNGGNIGTRYLWTSEQIKPNLSSRYNLAYGRKTAMNIWGDESNNSSLGVDGDREGTFGFFISDKNLAWWHVDLGDEQNVSEVVIYKMKSGSILAIPFEVLLLSDGNTVSLSQTIKSEDAADAWRISAPGVKARFVGLRTLGPGLLHFSEVEVYK